MSEELPLDKRMEFNTNCLDPDPICSLNGTEPLIVSTTDAAGKVITVCDLVNNVPACELADFSDTPDHHEQSEVFLLTSFGITERVCHVFEPTEHPGVSHDYRILQFENPELLNQKKRQRYETAMLYPPTPLAKPPKRSAVFVPLEDYPVSEIMSAFPGNSSNNPVSLDDSEESEKDSNV